jgi:hypothetical protein
VNYCKEKSNKIKKEFKMAIEILLTKIEENYSQDQYKRQRKQ